ncbi:MAG: indole-3-glycerol phosphate synthase TrpC [Candidatus Omnitrophica bacterium]|nr:indole-3-glycerol phosphate synthase TrpC [Candidatus Omnitrophota bacterium]
MSKNFLEEIIAHKKRLLEGKKAFFDSLRSKAMRDKPSSPSHFFQKAISQPSKLNLIAEIKKASPSKGVIRSHFDILDLAEKYASAGAAAISVLTEEKYFLGSPGDIDEVSSCVKIPVLTKDFIISEEQIYETSSLGSSAVLLIVAILTDKELKRLMITAEAMNMGSLVEAHSEDELKRAIDCGAEIIGVNSRNLKTFEVDFKTFEKFIPRIPKGTVAVAESGIRSHEQIKILKDLGAHAVLIGEAFLREGDIEGKIKEIMNG